MNDVVARATDRPQETSAEFTIGVRAVPYLADHGFQDMVVLPGSYYIEMALRLDGEVSKRAPGIVRNVRFHNPVILSAGDTVIQAEVRDHGDGRVDYAFYEVGGDHGGVRPPVRQLAAQLEIHGAAAVHRNSSTGAFSTEVFQAQSRGVIRAEQLYKTLLRNGNQYGPQFQNVSSIWQTDDQTLGALSVPRQDEQSGSHRLDPRLVDSVTQLLAPFVMDGGRTFVLRSIDEIELVDIQFPEFLWGHAVLQANGVGEDAGVRANVRVFDHSGRSHLNLSGVAFRLLDPIDAGLQAPATLNIASNFTCEPLEEPLQFWARHFGARIRIEFAPYNQIFQQLLDASAAFRTNKEGANIILLGLEEWAAKVRPSNMDLDPKRATQCFGTRPRCVLPNGLEIVHLNSYETEYLYKEVFEDQCYLRHGIELHDGDTVVDIGANIGLFSLFVMSRCNDPRIYAYEPAPVVYDLLKANCEAYGSYVRAFNVGVSDRSKTATFTFYEKSSVFSGFHSDEREDREAIQAVVRDILTKESIADEFVDEYVDALTADRLRGQACECRLISVSDLIRDNGIERIDLLKIDAEKSELDIINGIDEHDWTKIDQIVIEVHDRTHMTVKQIEELLAEKGYHCVVEQEALLEHAGFVNLYATRREKKAKNRGGEVDGRVGAAEIVECPQSVALQRNVQDFSNALRSFMDRAAVPLILCVAPTTPAANAEPQLKAALRDAEQRLLAEAATIANVLAISSTALMQRYPVHDCFDAHSHHAAHIPYTPECYAAIGTELVRTLFNAKRNPLKVIVLDCDNTLWKGVCGEEGPLGVQLTPPYRALQEIMIGQMNAGMLLCLCSKNNERDALEVFEQRGDMPLKREHLVSWRINWKAKSENLKSLAEELDLGLDSFAFIDDNPIDCAEVRINCPSVLTLQLPSNADSFVRFLNHVWAFDRTVGTEEDRNRTRMYRQNAERRQYREKSLSLKEFIDGLQLVVEVSDVTQDQIARVSQLTFRTNQFNLCAIRRSENEIRENLERGDGKCLVVRVVDRFGDYGLVGAVMYRMEADRCNVDAMMLSCRVLGRGVEHAVVAEIGRRGLKAGKEYVEFAFRQTEKNLPALDFMTSIGARYRNESGTSWIVPAERLASVEYVPDDRPGGEAFRNEDPTIAPRSDTGRHSAFTADGAARSELLQRIGEDFYDAGCVTRAMERFRLGQAPLSAAAEAIEGSALEMALASIWRRVLGRPRLGVSDNFFDAGGTSLKAVQVIAMIKKELNRTLSIVSLFECPTVRLLAAKWDSAPASAGARTTATDADSRGRQRRYGALGRRAP